MRQEFIENVEAQTEEAVYDVCPWANVVVPAEGGWWAFESAHDAETWFNQQ